MVLVLVAMEEVLLRRARRQAMEIRVNEVSAASAMEIRVKMDRSGRLFMDMASRGHGGGGSGHN